MERAGVCWFSGRRRRVVTLLTSTPAESWICRSCSASIGEDFAKRQNDESS